MPLPLPNKTVVWEKPAQKDKREKLITHSGNVDHVEEETKKKNLLGKRLLQQEAPYPAWVLAQRWRGEHQELPRLG